MTELIAIVTVAILVSAMCSLFEAVLYAVPLSYVENLAKEGRRSGIILKGLRHEVERPIAAILALNTVANAAGASLAGAVVSRLFGIQWLGWFSAGFTVVILLVSEILPKTTGVVFSRPLARLVARPLQVMVWMLTPLVWVCQIAAKIFKPEESSHKVSSDDLLGMTRMGAQSGSLEILEATVIQNMLKLEAKTVEDIMTHRSQMISVNAEMTVREAIANEDVTVYSRIPVSGAEMDEIIGIVQRRDLLSAAADGKHDMKVEQLMKSVRFVANTTPLDQVLRHFLDQGRQLFVVADAHGGLDGVISLEDVLEEILGREIEDEFDDATDKRDMARQRRDEVMKRMMKDKEGGAV